MSRLPSISSNKVIKRLLKAGFDYAPIKGKGSHIALVRVGESWRKVSRYRSKKKPDPKGDSDVDHKAIRIDKRRVY